jgi:DNA-binding MarR family transcriptional regulator
MSRGQQTFKQSDVTKALKAAVKAGIAIERVEIDKDGKIVIVTGRPEDAANAEKAEKNEWDGVLQ